MPHMKKANIPGRWKTTYPSSVSRKNAGWSSYLEVTSTSYRDPYRRRVKLLRRNTEPHRSCTMTRKSPGKVTHLSAKSKLPPKPSGSMGIPSELYSTDADSWTINTLLSNGIGRKNGCYRICAGRFIVNSPAQIFYSSSSKAVLLRPMYALHHHGRFH